MEDGLLGKIADDPVLLADILYTICVPDTEKTEQAEKIFMAALSGDAVEQATMALLQEIADFFPKAKGALLRNVLELARAQEIKAAATLEEILKSQELENGLKEAMNSFLSSPTKLEESLESTQMDLPSGS